MTKNGVQQHTFVLILNLHVLLPPDNCLEMNVRFVILQRRVALFKIQLQLHGLCSRDAVQLKCS